MRARVGSCSYHGILALTLMSSRSVLLLWGPYVPTTRFLLAGVTYTVSFSRSDSLTLTLTHPLSLSLTHTHPHTHSPSNTLTLTYTHPHATLSYITYTHTASHLTHKTGGSRLGFLPHWLIRYSHARGIHFVTTDYRLIPSTDIRGLEEDVVDAHRFVVDQLGAVLRQRGYAGIDTSKVVV